MERSPSLTDDGQEAIEGERGTADIIADQLPNILGTGLYERISTLRRSPEVSSAPDEVQVSEIRDRA